MILGVAWTLTLFTPSLVSLLDRTVAEAETVDPWDEPEEMITGQPQKRDPVVRFA